MRQHQLLLARARALGIGIKEVSDLLGRPSSILTFRNRSELFLNGVPASRTNMKALLFCDNKALTKTAFADLGIPFPRSRTFTSADDPALNGFLQEGRNYVCKPIDNTNGLGVVMHIRSMEMVKRYFETHRHIGPRFLLEEQLEGQDLRLQIIGGQMAAACIREPAFVLGNGRDTLAELVRARQAIMHGQNPENKLEIDEPSRELLASQGLSLESIPGAGQKVQLKYVCNMAQGGVATDVTDAVHPIYAEWARALVDYLETDYMGIDFIVPDFREVPGEGAGILEINARAEWLHHTFSEGRTHDIPGLLLQDAFELDG
ncbi:MAG: ATP-grasp domain-containing protein [Lewinellaceae bacterium]|nr:ATP-grasp domain-containing protein [Lewinellaceae bacterium]